MHDDPDDDKPVAKPRRLRTCTSQPKPPAAERLPIAMAWPDIARWRKAERERLIAARLAIPADTRTAMSARIAEGLDAIDRRCHRPHRSASTGRFAASRTFGRGWPRSSQRGGTTALPVVVEKAHPLIFRAYRPGDRLEKGVWNIPIPAEGDPVIPDVVIAPLVGVDPRQLPAGLWRRLLRPHAGLLAAKTTGHRRRLRDAAHPDHPPAAARHPDGPGRDG